MLLHIKYKNDIIARAILDILSSGNSPAQIRDQVFSVLSYYNTSELNLETKVVQPGYTRPLKQCLLIDATGKIREMELVTNVMNGYLLEEYNLQLPDGTFKYTLKDLNRILFSFAPFPEYAGEFRNYTTFLPTTGTDLCPWEDIRFLLENVDIDVQKLVKKAPSVKNHNDMNAMLEYLDDSVEVMCKLIKIHPFGDGNGRTIRGFTNKLFEDAGLPPIYIKANERTEYHKAMNLANNENDYTAIKQFYRYKVCDSIIELDINERLKEEEKPKQIKKTK